jgi:hypothetical protein
LNSGVNDRRGRGFLRSVVSILDILSGAVPLMVDVRQTGESPMDAVTLIGCDVWPRMGEVPNVSERRVRM